ncbi:hypothetical protein IMX07_08875 [bacterium]|nr:hypothetical protein [bacterium]
MAVDFGTLVDAPIYYTEFEMARRRVQDFLAEVFPGRNPPALEDVFTLLDETIARRQRCQSFSSQTLDGIREDLKHTILFLLQLATERYLRDTAGASDFYRRLAAHFILERMRAGKRGDPIAVLIVNWDSVFEDTVYWCLHRVDGLRRLDIDYCCYTNPLGRGDPHTPSLLQKAKGLYNLKVIKLHGSINWLICSNCEALFTGLGSKRSVWEDYAQPPHCPICFRTSRGSTQAALEGFFVSPTFVKVFDNAHIRMAWHNAYLELAEADRVVFVGYSLPAADFHVRTLLRRSIRPDAEIIVVLRQADKPGRTTPVRLRASFAAVRYKDFFGERARITLGGVRRFFKPIIPSDLDGTLHRIGCLLNRRPRR